jgi:hypothetical protein
MMGRRVSCGGIPMALVAASLVFALAMPAARADQGALPQIGLPRPASATATTAVTVLGCELTPNVQAVKSCLDAAVSRLNQDVASAKDAAREAQRRLEVPWVSAMTQFDGAPLQRCLAGKGIDLRATMLASGQNPAEFFRSRLAAAWQRGMGSGALIGQSLSLLTGAGAPPSPLEIVDRADALAAQLAAQDPIAQCIWTGIEPLRAQAKQAAQQLYPALKAQLDTAIEQQVRPAINRAIVAALRSGGPSILQPMPSGAQVVAQGARIGGQAVRTGAQQLAGVGAIPDDIRLAALGRAMRYMMDPVRLGGAQTQLAALAAATQSGNGAAAAAALAALERDLPTAATLSDEFALAVGIEIIRGQGHQLIETTASVPVDLIMWAFDKYADGLSDSIKFSASVGWLASAAFVGLSTFLVGSMLDLQLWVAKLPIVVVAKQGYDLALDAAFRALREKRSPTEMIATAGPFGEILREFPSSPQLIALSVPEIQSAQSVLAAYHRSVLQLARAAAARTR